MIGPSGLYGLGLHLGIAEQLPGKEVICDVCVHPVMWIGCVTMCGMADQRSCHGNNA